MRDNYPERFVRADAAEHYDEAVYAPRTFDAHVSDLQIAWLRQLVEESFPHRCSVHLDYACGTGRILAGLEDVVGDSHGFDVSQAMLDRARTRSRARLHLVGAGEEVVVPELGRRPVVVTAFRLLLNADDATRAQFFRFAGQALGSASAGMVVFNNHGNRTSLRTLAALKPWTDKPAFNTLSDWEVRRITRNHRLRVDDRYGVGLLPPTFYRLGRRGARLASAVNAATAGKRLTLTCADVSYVATLE